MRRAQAAVGGTQRIPLLSRRAPVKTGGLGASASARPPPPTLPSPAGGRRALVAARPRARDSGGPPPPRPAACTHRHSARARGVNRHEPCAGAATGADIYFCILAPLAGQLRVHDPPPRPPRRPAGRPRDCFRASCAQCRQRVLRDRGACAARFRRAPLFARSRASSSPDPPLPPPAPPASNRPLGPLP